MADYKIQLKDEDGNRQFPATVMDAVVDSNGNTVASRLQKLEDATYKNKGFFATEVLLREAHPNAEAGSKAYVGTAYPYSIYIWDISEQAWVDSGEDGGGDNLELNDYYTKSQAKELFVSKTLLSEEISDVYSKSETDSRYVASSTLTSLLENYYTKETSDSTFVLRTEFGIKLKEYLTTQQIAATYVSTDYLTQLIADYYTKNYIDSTFVTKAVFDEELSTTNDRFDDYYTITETKNIINIETSALSQEIDTINNKLTGYYTKEETENAISDRYEVLSESSYESLATKEEKFYFCYEEE